MDADEDKKQELEAIQQTARRLMEDIKRQEEALAKSKTDVSGILEKRSAAAAAATDSGDVVDSDADSESDEYAVSFKELEQARILDEMRAQSAELAKLRAQAEKGLAELRAAQHASDRQQPATVTVARGLFVSDIQQYFATYGDAQIDHRASLPAAFCTQQLGGGLQAPGAIRPEAVDPDAEQARLRAQMQLLSSTMSMMGECVDSVSRVISACEKAGQLNVQPAETLSVPDLEEQMMMPIGDMPTCSSGAACVVLGLPPHSNGHHIVLKQFQPKGAFAAFKETGHYISTGSMAQVIGRCLPCLLLAYARRCSAAMQLNRPCSEIKFPFSVVVERPGGFRRSALISSDTMPVAWPNVAEHHFEPVEREFRYSRVNLATGQKEVVKQTVYGYKFRAQLLFDHSVYSSGTDKFPALSMRNPLDVITQTMQEPSVPRVLSDDVRVAIAIAIAESETLSKMIDMLLAEFDATVRVAMCADADVAEARRAEFSSHWNMALMLAPEGMLKNSGLWSPRTHSVLAATLWRVGFALWLQSRQELNGNTNLTHFLSAHTKLQKWLFGAWVRLGNPPSDQALFSADVGVITVESACAVLTQKQLYPFYAVAHLSPAHQREVCVTLHHRCRTAPLDIVRRAVLPVQLTAAEATKSARACARDTLQHLCELWTPALRAALVSSGWLLANDTDSPAATDIVLLHRSPEVLKQWIAKAISLVALQSIFEDSVWLLRTILERWPWFQRAAAAQTSNTSLGADIADRVAHNALNSGCWIPVNFDVSTRLGEPARLSALPADAPAYIRALKGYSRFSATYQRPTGQMDARGDPVCVSVSVGQALYPDALLNLHTPAVHAGCYVVLAALRLRVYELQRLAAKHDEPLRVAFEKMLRKSRAEEREAADPMRHPHREVGQMIRRVVLGTGSSQPTDLAMATGPQSLPLAKGATLIDVAEKIASRWPSVDNVMQEAIACETVMTESITDELLGPLMRDHTLLMYPNGKVPWMGVPLDTPGRELGYQTRCALFECLEMAYQLTLLPDASDAYWLGMQGTDVLRPIDMHTPLSCAVGCEDTLPDVSAYIGLDVLHESGRPDFTSDIPARHSWIPQVATSMHKACYIRDWGANHAQNCRHSEYSAWAAQALLVSMQGTYRHACSTQRFERVVEAYAHLRPRNSHTREGREKIMRYLIGNTYKMLVAAREFQMMSIMASPAWRDVIAAAWPNFRYVQRCWVPRQAERMRQFIGATSSWRESERQVREMTRDEEKAQEGTGAADKLVPRVFRHLPPTWSHKMLALFCRTENDRHTEAKVRSVGVGQDSAAGLLPPIVNMIPPELKHAMVRYFSQTDPCGPIKLKWFADCGVSKEGLAYLVLINALYATQERSLFIRMLLNKMQRVDFVFAWTALHVLVLHRDSLVLPVTWELAQRQFVAAQYRAGDMTNPPPEVFTHMRFCHPLGCPGAQSYHVPFADAGHYGAQEDMIALDLGRVTCGRQKSIHMFDKLVRRASETQVAQMSEALCAIMVALENTSDPSERRALELDLARQRDKLATHQSTNVRATISVMMTRPCNEAPAQDLRVVGTMVVRKNSVHPRERPRVYTACPSCAMPTIYSMDRYGPNGFMCGMCNREVRWAEHGKWCISCGHVEQAARLPRLTGEDEADARAARTEHHIQGSSMQARSLKAHLTRTRHDDQVKRQAVAKEKKIESETLDKNGAQRDNSDTLDAPLASAQTTAQHERQERWKPKQLMAHRRNTASKLQLGRSLVAVHPFPLKMRMEPFSDRVVFDDRPGGHFTSMVVAICRPCENRILIPTISLLNILEQTQAEPEEIWVHGKRVMLTRRRRTPIWRPRYYTKQTKPVIKAKGKLVMLDN